MGEALSEERQFTDEEVAAARTAELLKQYINSTGKSQNDIAKAIGMSPAALTQFLKGTYPGNVTGITQKIASFLAVEYQRADAVEKPEFAMTSIAKSVISAISYAHINKDMALIYGDAGLGKTMAIQYYMRTHTDAIYISADPTVATPKAIVEEILDAIGKHQYGTLRQEKNLIISALKGTGRLLIIDEAQHLTLRALEVMRAIYDKAEGIGMVFCGNQAIHDRMYGRGEAAFAQFFSRIGIRRCLQPVVTEEDMDMIFDGRHISREVREYLLKVANMKGGIRYMIKLYMLAMTLARAQNKPLDMDYIAEAKKTLMGDA
jgi:hypothetical protein